MLQFEDNLFFNEDALFERLTNGANASGRQVVFVVGAPLTAPHGDEQRGVADVSQVADLIRGHFLGDQRQLTEFDRQVREADNRYQAAFRFLQGRRGQDIANQVIRQAVLRAYKGSNTTTDVTSLASMSEDDLHKLDENLDSWVLSPGAQALGEILSFQGAPFGRLVVTSNFDPLIGVAIKKAGGEAWRTAIHSDGDFSQSHATGCQIVHIHGYWYGTDTLHTGNQLIQKRPFLRNSLLTYLRDKTVVVMAYGGWEDIFTASIANIVENSSTFPEILWAFHSAAPVVAPHLRTILEPGVNRNRVTFYSSIDCHTFLPRLVDFWRAGTSTKTAQPTTLESKPISKPRFTLKGLECDRPPSVEAWVGREPELRALETTSAKVISICGIGGQGKSTLAAKYLLSVTDGDTDFQQWDWRDCKEEGDRIRTQIIAAIERMLLEKSIETSLDAVNDSDLVDIFIATSLSRNIVFVFDNVDHYIDLEKSVFIGILDTLVRRFNSSESKSRIIITCRPHVNYDLASAITLSIKGLSLEEAFELFEQRTGSNQTPKPDIEAAHDMTAGHAFWLDLLAVQVARVPGVTLRNLIEDVRRGRGGAPDVLSSIWKTLAERERVVLRVMAEAKRPETEEMIEKFISAELNYKNFKRAMKALIALNLIVVKPEKNAADLYDLHPLVRQFVKKEFERPERVGFIKTVINQYVIIIRGIESMLGVYLPLPLLERWSQKAELEIEAGLHADAFETLDSAIDALVGGGHSEEYVRVARKLLEAIDWTVAPSTIKNFDNVLSALVMCLDQLEENTDADEIISRYEQTMTSKTARYIKYCDVRAYSFWQRREFTEAIEWAERGQDLKKRSDVDTIYDCSHTLALARRDGGDPEKALEYFIKSYELKDLIDPKSNVADAEPTTLGNVGRCLQLLGRLEEALVCYRKSAKILENDDSRHRLSNQTYARQWIADALYALNSTKMSYCFYEAAEEIAGSFAPGRQRTISQEKEARIPKGTLPTISRAEAKRLVEAWVNGRSPLVV